MTKVWQQPICVDNTAPTSTRCVLGFDSGKIESKAAQKSGSSASSTRESPLTFNPMQVLAPEQLEAFNFLADPIWIFDFVKRQNRWANAAGLLLWESPSLEEFVGRDMSRMNSATEERTRKAQRRVEQGSCVKEKWTIYPPNGGDGAKTVQLSATGLKLHAEDDHCVMLCFAIPIETKLGEKPFMSSSRCTPLSFSALLAECTPTMDSLVTESDNKLRARAMLQHLPLAVCQFDMNGKTLYHNPASMFVNPPQENQEGSSNSEDETDDTSALCPEASMEELKEIANGNFSDRFVDSKVARAALKTIQGQDEAHLQAELYTKNGPQWSAVELRKMIDPITGRPVILFTSQDKTDALNAKREREASVQKSEFLAIMAHEIRTPLHQVIGFTDLLSHTRLTSEQSSFVQLLKSSSQGMMTVISDVLDYSKLEAGQMKIERIAYEPLGVLHGSMAAVRSSCEDKGLHLTMTWNKKIPFRIMGDPNRLRQILLNLLSNAIKFTKTGGIEVDVLFIEVPDESTKRRNSSDSTKSTSKTKSWIKFVVTDTGCGIPKEHQKTIFEKHQQGNVSVARNYGGTGLGLSICQLLVNSMKGDIGVDSHEGHGSSFWAALPIELPEECSSTSDESETNFEETDHSLNILLAEDNRINQKLMKNIFKRFGYELTIAQNGKEAVDMVQKDSYDVVFMDIQMPVMDGLEATRRLRSMGYKDLPIYGLTASVKQSDFIELGFNDWLPKPIPMNDLKAKLQKLLKSKRLAEQYS
jgi:signal transduction histidine kinase/ActR/RegA family two-component response regulator